MQIDCVNFAQAPTSNSSVPSEQKIWEQILEQHGLSMDAGRNTRINTGFNGWNAFEPFDYEKPTTNARQHSSNRQIAERIEALVGKGLSIRAIARELHMSPYNVRRSRRRFQEHFTQAPALDSSEGDGR